MGLSASLPSLTGTKRKRDLLGVSSYNLRMSPTYTGEEGERGWVWLLGERGRSWGCGIPVQS